MGFRPAVELLEQRLAPAVSFAVQQTFASGTGPVAVATADFNGDGRPDLAVANSNSNTVSILLDTTAPGAAATFSAQQTFAVGSVPVAITAADFNGDGRPDLAVANLTDNTVSVLLNTTPAGSAVVSFAVQQTFAVGSNPRSIAAGDFNGDGRADLAVADSGTNTTPGNTVSVLLNTTPAGTGVASFTAQQTFAVGASPFSVVAADFNGDGRPDLAVADEGINTVSVLLDTTSAGSATPSFAIQQTFTVGPGPQYLTAGDFNGDGIPDLATSNTAGNTVSVLLDMTPAGSGTLSFGAQQTFAVGSNPEGVAVGDFDGDGRPDLAVNNFLDRTVSVLVNGTSAGAGTPSFAAQQTFALGSGPFSLTAADFSGDGRSDLAVANSADNTMSVLLNTTASFASTAPVVVGQFGSQGVWEYNRALGTWLQLTPANAALLAANSHGDVVGEFKGFGTWLYRPASGWKQIGTGDASVLVMDALGDVAGTYPGHGVWLYRPAVGFQQIGTGDASVLAMDSYGDVAGSYLGHGVWLYRPAVGFQQIGTGDASALVMDASGDVAGSYPGHGIWEYHPATGFQQTGTADASTLAMDAQGDVVGSFSGHGIWEYRPAAGFKQIGPVDAAILAMGGYGDAVGTFAGHGVWEFDPYRGWYQLTTVDAVWLTMA
jgi:hypothetical protein